MRDDRAAFYRVLQREGEAQIVLVLLNKSDAPAAFAVRELLEPGRWRAAFGRGVVEVAEGGALSATVPGHGVEVYLLDAPVRRADLAAALTQAMAMARRAE